MKSETGNTFGNINIKNDCTSTGYVNVRPLVS